MDLHPLLERHGQSHLIAALERLDAPGRSRLEAQLAAIDWDAVAQAHSTAGLGSATTVLPNLAPAQAELPSPSQVGRLRETGLELLSQGKAAFVLMAGGQGSRLGYGGPKGCAPLGFPNNWTLFDLLCRRLQRLGRLVGHAPLFLVMTSPENDATTREWFAHHYELLPAGSVQFFQQGVFPAMDDRGRVLLSAPDQLALAPDGNGGVFLALKRTGMLKALQAAGVEWLHIAGVDNALSVPCDPVFLGFAATSGAPVASKSVLREDPSEKAGVFRLDGEGKPGVAEYTEVGDLAAAQAPDGGLLFREANIASHLVRLETASRFAHEGLPWHLARKKLAHLSPDTGASCQDPVCKYERFLFDAFPLAGEMALLRVERTQEFAPVKNADGVDSPATALAALRDQAARWRSSWSVNDVPEESPLRRGDIVDPALSLWGEFPGVDEGSLPEPPVSEFPLD